MKLRISSRAISEVTRALRGRHPQGAKVADHCASQGVFSVRRSAQQGFTTPARSTQQGFKSPLRSAQQGFTLLEMLVALAVFSIAALALVRLQAVSVRTAADLTSRTIAQITAQNLATERLTDPTPPTLGETSGTAENGGRSLQWTQTAQRMDDARLIQIDIRVTGRPGEPPAVVNVVRPATLPGQVAP